MKQWLSEWQTWALFAGLGGYLLAVALLTGCAATKAPRLDQVGAGVRAAAQIGCAQIPESTAQRASSLVALSVLEAAVEADPARAGQILADQAGTAPAAWVWHAVHLVLDALPLSGAQWLQTAAGVVRPALEGCRAGLGVTAA